MRPQGHSHSTPKPRGVSSEVASSQRAPVDPKADQRSQELPAARPAPAKGPAPSTGPRAKTPRQTCRARAGGPRSKCRSGSPQSIYVTILKEYLKPVRLSRLENRVKERTVEALKKLDKLIQEARIRQEQLLQDSRQLQEEKLRVEAENSSFLKYLSKKNDQCREKHEEQWQRYFHECEDIERQRRALARLYAKRTADLQAQLLQGRKTQISLKQKIEAMSYISLVKERQEMKIQMLLREKEKVKAETVDKDWEAHLQFLQQKALLDRQMRELDMLWLTGSNTEQLNSKVEALKLTAKKALSDFCHEVNRENKELRKELWGLSQEYHKLEALKLQLIKQIQQLKEEHWYLEALIRGRQQLQKECGSHCACNQCPKDQRSQRSH